MKKYTIGVDIGTTNLCVVLVDSYSCDLISIASAKNNTLISSDNPACFEQDAVKIVNIILNLFGELITQSGIDPTSIEGVAVTGQMHGVLLVNDSLNIMSPLYTWRDRRSETSGVLEECLQKLPADYYKSTGCRLSAGFGGATLAWLLNNAESKNELRSLKALTISDYLVAVLTGVMGTDYSHAASWGIFDIVNGQWSQEILDVLDIPPSMLPEVAESGVVIGCVLPDASSTTTLSAQTKVWVAIGDNQASFFGATKSEKRVAVINLGTSGQITLPSETIYVENGIETRPLPGGRYLHVGATLCGGWSYAYLASFFRDIIENVGGVEIDSDVVYDKMKELIAKRVEAGKTSMKVETKFSGTRDGQGVQSGSIIGIDESNLTAENMINGFLCGMVEELAEMIPESDISSQSNKRSFDKLLATGNAIRLNPVLLKIIEDVVGIDCEMSDVIEEAATGAALFAINHGK